MGQCADDLTQEQVLATPARALEVLQNVEPLANDPPLTPDRLRQLAVSASTQAALSNRLEIYPRGMSAARAFKLGLGSLQGPTRLTVDQIRQRIASRYPEAEALPNPPELDDLIREAGLDWVWDATLAGHQGGYRSRTATALSGSTASSHLSRHIAFPGADAERMQLVQDFEARLHRSVSERRFLVLLVSPPYLHRAEAALLVRLPVVKFSLETLLLQAMKAAAQSIGARWDVVCQADAAPRDSREWRNLQTVVRQAMPPVEQTLLAASQPVLLVYPGLLARYGQMALLERLRDACAKGQGAPGFVVLIASDDQHAMPVMDGTPVPVVQASEWARVPDTWLCDVTR